MSWETAAVIMTALIAATAAVVKTSPKRSNGSSVEFAVLKTKMEQLEKSYEDLRKTVLELVDRVMDLMDRGGR
jgi:putative lipoic acid-binding regulatory protein